MKTDILTRRNLVVAAGVAGLGAAAESAAANPPRAALSGPYVDVNTPQGSLLAHARLSGNIDPSQKRFDWFDGQVMAVAGNGNVTPLISVRGHIETGMAATGNAWRLQRRLFATYYDSASGKALSDFHNPLTGARVKVSHVTGAHSESVLEEGASLHWRQDGANFYLSHAAQIDFAPLTGLSTTTHLGAIADLQDAARTTVRDIGSWTLVTAWLPWLKMGQTAGHCVLQCRRGGGMEAAADLPSEVLADAPEASIA